MISKNAKISFITLRTAVEVNNLELAKFLISKGININDDNFSIFDLKLSKDKESYYLSIIEFLLANGANYKGYLSNEKFGNRLLEETVINGYERILMLLISIGADIHIRDDRLLVSAANFGKNNIIKILLARGANIHAHDDDALINASEEGNTESVDILLKHGANVNAQDGRALTEACINNHGEVVELLLNAGATISDALMAQVSANPALSDIKDQLDLARSPKSKEQMTCGICYVRPKDTVVTPCGHTFCNQ